MARLRPDDPRVWQRALTQTEAEEVRALLCEHLPSGCLCFRMLLLWRLNAFMGPVHAGKLLLCWGTLTHRICLTLLLCLPQCADTGGVAPHLGWHSLFAVLSLVRAMHLNFETNTYFMSSQVSGGIEDAIARRAAANEYNPKHDQNHDPAGAGRRGAAAEGLAGGRRGARGVPGAHRPAHLFT